MLLRARVSRRTFARRASALLGLAVSPTILPASALGAEGQAPPSDQIALGVIGYGGRCTVVLDHFMEFTDLRCLALADCQAVRRRAGKARVDARYANTECVDYSDFRALLDRQDIEAVLIATGDRWHTPAAILAAQAGKDVYSEKPISITIAEGRALVETMARYRRVYQAGHQRRSVDSYRFQAEVVRRGLLGKLHTILCQQWEGPTVRPQAPQPVPPGFDYEMWLGPAPWHPYTHARVSGWNYFWDTGGGPIIGMGCHYTDLAQWALDRDDTGPVAYEGEATFDPTAFSETPVTADIRCTYADGVKIVLRSSGTFEARYIRFVGSDGWVQVDDQTNVVTAEPQDLLRLRAVSARSWAHTGDHARNFLDCVKSRARTLCHPEAAHRATTICHAANLCIRLGRPLTWDPKAERFLGDDEANRLRSRVMREPWTL
ncbi:MAG TPA: Gfo/Idh/MocA family oxidoreductase [Planctomycetota bacterium]|nr:Gfo/Idh/MocA family oxidoreductase [Planctomycetota bacterium]HRR78951.1 Gfo/Idh/MocA family oxidoreductase [Planctomycetota bacterium]HRT92771.1 Gfo/Idh/MocA family oxidoreductase [Planctomycetota bacterium]